VGPECFRICKQTLQKVADQVSPKETRSESNLDRDELFGKTDQVRGTIQNFRGYRSQWNLDSSRFKFRGLDLVEKTILF
jgi:hypothetical protein